VNDKKPNVMRAKNIWKYIVLIIIILSSVSCEELIDLKVHDSNLEILVVEGMITTDTTAHYVWLSLTGGFYLEKETPKVSGARVKILDDTGHIFELEEQAPGVYKTEDDVYGLPGVNYTLVIEYDNTIYEATSKMSRLVYIDSLSYRWDNFINSYRILLYGQEPSGVGDSYMWHLYKNGELVTDRLSKIQIANDDFIDGNYINGFEVDGWDTDFNFRQGDTILVAKHVITKETFNYLAAVFQERTGGMSGMRPPANIPSNVSNGALGWFHTAAITRATIVIPE
jgi:hypothetical protein